MFLFGFGKHQTVKDNNLSATEESVGITRYLTQQCEMNGIIKHKYSDFHVHEIDEDGEVVCLTSLNPLNAPLPEGFEEWYASSDPIFHFYKSSSAEVDRIYASYLDLVIRESGDRVTLEKISKRRPVASIVKFVLCKMNESQQVIVGQIAKKLQINSSKIQFAGTKDKRGITTQLVTIRNMNIETLLRLGNPTESSRIGMFRYTRGDLFLGALTGNRFSIVLRDISVPSCHDRKQLFTEIGNRISKLKETGFINYFGMQRFGTTSISTHLVGREVIKRNFKGAIELLLKPALGDRESINAAKEEFAKNHDPETALRMLPRSSVAEKAILSKMIELGDRATPEALFNAIDRRQRTMYVHAYQSYLWNAAASARAERGSDIVRGDLVRNPEGSVVTVTSANINRFDKYDIVIPLPSPDNFTPEMLKIMKAEGVTTEMFDKMRSLGVHGDERVLFARPEQIEYELIEHDDPDAELIDSDIDRLEGTTNAGNHVPGGKHVSLLVSFSLKSSQYATMCLRELMHRTTEWWGDARRSEAHSAEDAETPSRCVIA